MPSDVSYRTYVVEHFLNFICNVYAILCFFVKIWSLKTSLNSTLNFFSVFLCTILQKILNFPQRTHVAECCLLM